MGRVLLGGWCLRETSSVLIHRRADAQANGQLQRVRNGRRRMQKKAEQDEGGKGGVGGV